ncbi:MAG: hypothetical protein ACOH5I_17885 [Oligoflexus sp.]
MAIGKIVSMPMPQSKWARIRDEYGNDWSVKTDDLPKNVGSGDDIAYRLDFSEAMAPRIQTRDPEK